MRKPKTPADYAALAAQRGCTWLGPAVANVMEKTNWQCACGHTWPARYNDLQQGHGCSKCAYRSRAIPPEGYHLLAAEHGCVWLGPAVSSVMQRTQWQCERGHIWWARYNDIQQGKGGCLKCCHLSQAIPPEQYHVLAAQQGYVWLGPVVANVMQKTQWRCELGHIWEARYNDVRHGYGCRNCARLARSTQHFSAHVSASPMAMAG